eukprot:Rhum_TRINITY_DN15259_c4_g1::Rhum_TRINITY_DN15259_c4_g1_i1::g.147212::m.147212
MQSRAVLVLLGVAACFASADECGSYSFVSLRAGDAVAKGNTDITNIGGETLDRGEWIQCKRVSYGLKRDIGTGGRVSGHTHYDRVAFTTTSGPAIPFLLDALNRGVEVVAKVKQFHNRRDGQEEKYMEITTTGKLSDVTVNGCSVTVSITPGAMVLKHVGEDGKTSASLKDESSTK